jgi:hypothetical protein
MGLVVGFMPDSFTLGKTASGTRCVGGWVETKTGLVAMQNIKDLFLVAGIKDDSRAVQPAGQLLHRLRYPKPLNSKM